MLAVTVTVSAPSNLDFVAVFTPATANTSATAPQRVAALPAAYLATGKATLYVRPVAMPGGVRIAIMRAAAGTDVSVSPPWPAYDSWLAAHPTEMPGGLQLPLAAPLAPTSLRATPGDASGSVRLSWTTATAARLPMLVWGASANALTTSVAAALVTTVAPSALCASTASPPLRSIAQAEGWTDLGFMYTAVFAPPPGKDAWYRVGDGAEVANASSWSSVTRFAAAPAPGLAEPSGGAPVTYLVVGDTGVGPDDSTINFRNMGTATGAGMRGPIAADVAAAGAGSRPRIVGLAHVGDLSYGDGLLASVADSASQYAPVTATVPIWWAVGNHEAGA